LKILKKIPLDKIKFSAYSVRTTHITNNLDDLKSSIQGIGLINPIIVCPNSNNTFDLIDGQKRKMVYATLNRENPSAGFEKIDCLVMSEPTVKNVEKVISLSTEVYNQPTSTKIVMENIHKIWCNYASFDLIYKKFGISKKIIKKYVKYDRLPSFIQKRIDDKQITLGTSLKVVDAMDWTNSDSEENLFKIIVELEKLKSHPKSYRKALKILKQSPNMLIETIIQDSITSTELTTIKITLPKKLFENVIHESKMNMISVDEYVTKSILEQFDMTGVSYDVKYILDLTKKRNHKTTT
jgi:hypothetical protein